MKASLTDFRKRSRAEFVAIAVLALLLIPLVLAAVAPLFAPIPAQATRWTAPALPNRDAPLPDFQHLLETFPLIVRDLPDEPSRDLVATYDSAIFTDTQAAARMLTDARLAIEMPSGLEASWNSWLETGQVSDGVFDALEFLQPDARNADRLNNLTIAMYFNWFASIRPDSQPQFGNLQRQAMELLNWTVEYFPENRASLLNNMFLRSVVWNAGPLENRGALFDEWLAAHPDDATAIQLAVSFFATDTPYEYVQNPELLRELATGLTASADPDRAALGHALLGDLELGNLKQETYIPFTRAEEAPYATMVSARRALQHYDQSLMLCDDASVYAARALALSLLGDFPAAIESQERAIALRPESTTLRLSLAELFLGMRGSTEEIRENLITARSIEREALAAIAEQETPKLSRVRPVSRATALTPLASNRPDRFFVYYVPPMAGGGYVVIYDEIPVFSRIPSVRAGQNPAATAIGSVIGKSEALGDVEGLAADIAQIDGLVAQTDYLQSVYRRDSEFSSLIARVVVDRNELDNVINDNEQSSVASHAASWLRFLGENEDAVELCQHAIDIGVNKEYPEWLYRCVAENSYLMGDLTTARKAYEAISDDFMLGYVAERSGNLDEALKRYRAVAESDRPNRYFGMLRLAGVHLQRGEPDDALGYYDEFIAWNGCANGECFPREHVLPYAHSNRGIARLQANVDGAIDCSGDDQPACALAFADFSAALEFDSSNPVFLMNQAWAARLLGDEGLSARLMTAAAEVDSTLYPVQNDLGVFAAVAGDTSSAKQHFLNAAAANPDYDLAMWNLGVLHMREGVSGLVRGQAYLARAIVRSPSLVTERLEFKTDERFYQVEIDEQMRPGSNWTFGAASSIAATAFGFVTLALVILHATYAVGLNKLQDILTARANQSAKQLAQYVPRSFLRRFESLAIPLLPYILALAVLVFTTAWLARSGEPNAAAASVAMALFAIVLAVVTHEAGHALAAHRLNASIQPAQWTPGTALSLLFLPLGLSSGPFPSQEVLAEEEKASSWVYLAGPLANLVVAIVAYLVFALQPMPFLRLIAQVQLASMGYALLPFVPLDGAAIGRSHPRILGAMSFAALLLGVMFTLGIL